MAKTHSRLPSSGHSTFSLSPRLRQAPFPGYHCPGSSSLDTGFSRMMGSVQMGCSFSGLQPSSPVLCLRCFPRPLTAIKISTTWESYTLPSSYHHEVQPWAPLVRSFCMLTLRRHFRRIHHCNAELFFISVNFSDPDNQCQSSQQKKVSLMCSWSLLKHSQYFFSSGF